MVKLCLLSTKIEHVSTVIITFFLLFFIHTRYNTLVRAYARFYDILLSLYTHALSRRSECYKGTELHNCIYEKKTFIY